MGNHRRWLITVCLIIIMLVGVINQVAADAPASGIGDSLGDYATVQNNARITKGKLDAAIAESQAIDAHLALLDEVYVKVLSIKTVTDFLGFTVSYIAETTGAPLPGAKEYFIDEFAMDIAELAVENK